MADGTSRYDEALEDLDLQAWLEQYVETKPGGGAERRIETCPKCLADGYRLYVNVEAKVWICYVCEWGRHLKDVTLLMAEVSGRKQFDIRKELVQSVKPAPTGDLQQKLMDAFFKDRELPKLISTPQASIALPGTDGFGGVTSSKVYRYLLGRGLTDVEIQLYRFRAALKLRGFMGPFALCPIVYDDKVVNWQGRRVEGKIEPKYVSHDDIGHWLWPVDSLSLAAYQYLSTAYLVEGVYDAAGMRRIGLPGHATFGKKISDPQIQLLQQLGVTTVFLCWDIDAARTSSKHLHTQLNDPKKRNIAMRGEIERAALRLRRHFTTKVVDLSGAPKFYYANGEEVEKPDPGEILRVPAIADWVRERCERAIDANSPEFFEWQLS